LGAGVQRARDDDGITIALTGDVMLGRNVARSLAENGRSFDYPFEAMRHHLRSADIAFCNLESPISSRGEALEKRYTFRVRPQAVWGLWTAGFRAVSLANNHALDYGPKALKDTVNHLKWAGIGACGLTTEGRGQRPLIVTRRGVRIGFLGYADPQTPYAYAREFEVFPTRPAPVDERVMAADLEAIRSRVDVLVVSVHWGIEYSTEPTARQRRLGRFLVDNGADIVAGHHPHVQQPAQWHDDGLIIFSLGNFVFDQHTRPLTRRSRLYRVVVDGGEVQRAEFLPLTIPEGDWQPRPTRPSWVSIRR
jgi:poly-gamma-glutamate synthesis protein (capsule biosynthesis protein)